MPWSAQWMSSNASTSGCSSLRASIAARTAEKNASRSFCGSSSSTGPASSGTSMPSRRATSAARRSTASRSPSSRSRSPQAYSLIFSQAWSALSSSRIPASARITSPSAQ